MLIIKLLNTVWRGAVQTDTLRAFLSMTSVLTGFLTTLIAASIFMVIKIRLHLKSLNRDKKAIHSPPNRRMSKTRELSIKATSHAMMIRSLLCFLFLEVKRA